MWEYKERGKPLFPYRNLLALRREMR